jgi:hypothetical protein
MTHIAPLCRRKEWMGLVSVQETVAMHTYPAVAACMKHVSTSFNQIWKGISLKQIEDPTC